MSYQETMFHHQNRRRNVRALPQPWSVQLIFHILSIFEPHLNLKRDSRDRFITNREDTEVAATLDLMSLNPASTSPGHTARLVAATGVPLNKRVLAYHEAPPVASDTTLTKQREIARPLYSRPGALPSSSGAVTNRSRKITTQPERVLDAPGMVDDFYLNLLSWSVQNIVAVALSENTYVWKADSGEV